MRRDWRERVLGATFRLLGPLIRRAIRAGLPAGPNVLLTVRGRRSGSLRTTPVAMLELDDGRRFLQASFGETNWVRNLRAAGEAVITRERRSERVRATEVAPEVAGALLHDALAPFHRSRLLRTLLCPTVRPPAAVMHRYRFRVDTTPDEFVAEAHRHSLFVLHPLPTPSASQDVCDGCGWTVSVLDAAATSAAGDDTADRAQLHPPIVGGVACSVYSLVVLRPGNHLG